MAATDTPAPVTAPGVIITTRARVLRGLLRLCPDTHNRPYLNGVYCDPAGYLVATCGTALVATRCQSFSGPGFIVRDTALKAVIRAASYLSIVCISRAALFYVKHRAQQTVAYTPADGQYPVWRQSLPTQLSGEGAQFDGRLLARLYEAVSDISGFHGDFRVPSVCCNGREPSLLAIDDPDTLAIIMPLSKPLRAFDGGKHVQRFLSPHESATEAA